jgi:hypothetical protein
VVESNRLEKGSEGFTMDLKDNGHTESVTRQYIHYPLPTFPYQSRPDKW